MSRRSRGGRPRRPHGGPPASGATPETPPPIVADDRVPRQPPAAGAPPSPPAQGSNGSSGGSARSGGANGGASGPATAGCTAPQLRRFIKSRVYVPLHELRRRFAIDGSDDDVHPVQLDSGRIFVGLPAPEARLLEELLRGGDVGYELSRDPSTPIVIGVYPMRPVARN